MAKRAHNRRRDTAALFSVPAETYSIYAGTSSMKQIAAEQCSPRDTLIAIANARHWQREHWFVGQALDVRTAFYNYGMTIAARDKADRKKVEKWLVGGSRQPGQRLPVTNFIRRSIEEFENVDNVVARWNNYNAPAYTGTDFANLGVKPPFLWMPEQSEYSDKFGLEVLKIKPDMTVEEMRDRKFPEKLIKRYSNGMVTLDPVMWGENFKVLRRTGFSGYAWPQLNWAFKCLKQSESMEVGEQALGMLSRTVLRLWKFGFEPKVAPLAQGNAKKWSYQKELAEQWQKFVRGLVGGVSHAAVQFDRKAEDVWVDPKNFDGKKWETVVNRLIWWSGPVGFMFLSKSVSPFLLGMLEVQAERDRGIIGPFLEDLILQSFQPPAPIKITWSNQCFREQRLAWDMLKTLMERGAASLTTGNERAGLDPEHEADNKEMEAEPGNAKKYLPLLLPGTGQKPGEGGGRKSGQKDNTSPNV